MIEQTGNALLCLAKFEDTDGLGVTGLDDIVTYAWRLTVSGTTITATPVYTAEDMAGCYMVEVGRGIYSFLVPAEDSAVENVMTFQCETANASVPYKSATAVWVVGKAGMENLDAALSGIDSDATAIKAKTDQLTFTGTDVKATLDSETVALSTTSRDDLVDKVWDEPVGLMSHNTSGTAGQKLTFMYDTIGNWATLGIQVIASSISSIASAVWNTALSPLHLGAGKAGQYVYDILGAIGLVKAKTDQFNFTGTDVKATLDSETVTVGTNNDKTGYDLATAPPTAAEIKTLMESAGSFLEAIKAVTDLLPADIAEVNDLPAAPDNAGIASLLARLTETRAAFLDRLDATVSSRMASFTYTAPDNTGIGEAKTAAEATQTLLNGITEDVTGIRFTEHSLSALSLSVEELEAIQTAVWSLQQSGQDISDHIAQALASILAKTNLISGALPFVTVPDVMRGTLIDLLEYGDYYQANWPVPYWENGTEWPADLSTWTATIYVLNKSTSVSHTFPATISGAIAPNQRVVWEVSKDDLDDHVGVSPDGRVIHSYALLFTNGSGQVITGATGNLRRTTFG